jgi:hypothetical protein
MASRIEGDPLKRRIAKPKRGEPVRQFEAIRLAGDAREIAFATRRAPSSAHRRPRGAQPIANGSKRGRPMRQKPPHPRGSEQKAQIP